MSLDMLLYLSQWTLYLVESFISSEGQLVLRSSILRRDIQD